MHDTTMIGTTSLHLFPKVGGLGVLRLAALSIAALMAVSSSFGFVDIATVKIGDAGNLADPSTNNGSVGYEYSIGTYEVTNAQYAAFLNDVAKTSDTYGLYNTGMASKGLTRTLTDGVYTYTATDPNKPVVYVSFWDAARFCNWQTTGNTETGVYALNGAINLVNSSIMRDQAYIDANGGWAVCSADEWYKAAYYDPATGDYYLYPTSSNTAPNASAPTDNPNSANYNWVLGTTTDAGSYPNSASPNGTFDQGGNALEWTDTIYGSYRELYGGSFFASGSYLEPSGWTSYTPNYENYTIGFRVSSLAPVPEPSATAALLGAGILGFVVSRRRGPRGAFHFFKKQP